MLFLKVEEFIMEKKEYISPVAEIVEVGTLSVLALSKDYEQIDSDEQMSNEYRGGDWENIWQGM